MIIIIDGYNLLKRIHPYKNNTLNIEKKILLKKLSIYKKLKSNTIKEIIIVYDGGIFKHASRVVYEGISVIESGKKYSADEWIISYLDRDYLTNLMVVSDDNEIIVKCHQHKVFTLDVLSFAEVVETNYKEFLSQKTNSETLNQISSLLEKYSHEEDEFSGTELASRYNHAYVDSLMEEATLMRNQESEKEEIIHPTRAAKKQTHSKKEKDIIKIIKKVY